VVDHARQLEFALKVAGAEARSTRIDWDEEVRTLSVHAVVACRTPAGSACESSAAEERDWYAEVPVGDDADGNLAEAFLKDGTLRIFVPRVDSQPLTGVPLLARPIETKLWFAPALAGAPAFAAVT
jgi:hypothetical protein